MISGYGILQKIYSEMLLILIFSLSCDEQVRKKKKKEKGWGEERTSGVGSQDPPLSQ